jgi:type 2 lantibiotic biosynthesis protein LanM
MPESVADSSFSCIFHEWLSILGLNSVAELTSPIGLVFKNDKDLERWFANEIKATFWANNNFNTCYVSELQERILQSYGHPLAPDHERNQKPFIDLWLPMHSWACERLGGICIKQGIPNHLFSNSALNDLATYLVDLLCEVSSKALWHEFSKGKNPSDIILLHLEAKNANGTLPRDAYREFIQYHRENGIRGLIKEYPVLAWFLEVTIKNWVGYVAELLARLSQDFDELQRTFDLPSSNPRINNFQLGLSDSHRGGRVVAILTFAGEDQTSAKLVYKPKDISLDIAYRDFLHFLNHYSALSRLKTLNYLSKDGYGYMEFVRHDRSNSEDEKERFYYNAGRLMSILYILGCTDCHHENLIAAGDSLHLIDTETLLEPEQNEKLDSKLDAIKPDQQHLPKNYFLDSVLKIGMLPQWSLLGKKRVTVDVSALGIASPQASHAQTDGWIAINTDGMLPGKIYTKSRLPTSLPVGLGEDNPLEFYAETLVKGFCEQSNEIIRIRDELGVDFFGRFEGLTRRIVLRATRVYFAIQEQQRTPHALKSFSSQFIQLGRLARSFLAGNDTSLRWPIYESERQEMALLDIPFFSHSVDLKHLRLDALGSQLPDFFSRTGIELARARLSCFNQEAIDMQTQLIRGSIMARNVHSHFGRSVPVEAQAEQVPAVASSSMALAFHIDGRQASTCIMDKLLSLAIVSPDGSLDWLGMDLLADGQSFVFGPVGHSLYGGSLGIACHIEYLHRHHHIQPSVIPNGILKENIVTAILKPIAHHVAGRSVEQRYRWLRDQAAGISGIGGVLLALGALRRNDWIFAINEALSIDIIINDPKLDILGGCAGLVGPLIKHGGDSAMPLLDAIGNMLLQTQGNDGAWRISHECNGLLGFSHGAAGFTAALARLFHLSGDHRLQRAACASLNYERIFFDEKMMNWPDFRTKPHSFITAWCHGAPGIALGRACLWGTDLWDERCADEIQISLRSMLFALKNEMSCDHLCCGSFGLIVMMRFLARGPWTLSLEIKVSIANLIEEVTVRKLKTFLDGQSGLTCFETLEGKIVLPGFFNGFSGMGMAILNERLADNLIIDFLSAGLVDNSLLC